MLLLLLGVPFRVSVAAGENEPLAFQLEAEPPLQFGLGATRDEVLDVLGRPDVQTEDGLWIFYREPTVSVGLVDRSDARRWDALVVRFTRDRVAAIKLTDGKVLRQRLAQRKIPAPGPS